MSDQTDQELDIQIRQGIVYSETLLINLLKQGVSPQQICLTACMLSARAVLLGLPTKSQEEQLGTVTEGVELSLGYLTARRAN